MITILALLALGNPAQASFLDATIGVSNAYRQDYQSERGQNAPEPVGYFLEKEGDEIISSVYFVDGTSLLATIFGCHQHGAEFDCHKENRADLGAYRRSTSLYRAEEFQKSVPLALDFFAKNVAPESSVVALKFWEAEENIRFVVTYLANGAPKTFFLACHFHGGGLDCHRKRDAGPGEPKN